MLFPPHFKPKNPPLKPKNLPSPQSPNRAPQPEIERAPPTFARKKIKTSRMEFYKKPRNPTCNLRKIP